MASLHSRRNFLSSITGLSIVTGATACKRPTAAVLDDIDASMRRFIRDAAISAGQIGILRDGSPIFGKVYAETPPSGYTAVTPQTLFRIASGSKIFTCAAIYKLQQQGKLDLNQRVFPLVGITQPAVATDHPDPHINDITIRHLVDHAGGWVRSKSFQVKGGPKIQAVGWDPLFRLRTIALELNLSAPPTKMDVARYMFGKPLQFVPGEYDYKSSKGATYGNFGYMLLGLVVESVTGQRYIDYIRDGLDGPAAWSNVFFSPMLSRQKNPLEVWYSAQGRGPTVLDPRSDETLPVAYGGGGFLTEVMDSAAGLMTNAETLARFASHHSASGLGPRLPGSLRDGTLPGSYSNTLCRPNGIDCTYLFNTKDFPGGIDSAEKFSVKIRKLLDAL